MPRPAILSPVFTRASIPNQLTVFRLVLAAAFFLVLNQYRYPHTNTAVLWVATVIFILAAITDYLDGYLARRWQVITTFGRIMDPFCDKVLVLGAFIYLAGPRFVNDTAVKEGYFLTMISGVYPWMVAVMLARELLVTGIRGELEGQGMKFGAKLPGKLKTIFQLIAIPLILIIIWFDPANYPRWAWMAWLRDGLVYATVLFTVISGVPYITGAAKAMKGK